jgi:hypothetical protein
LATSGRLRASGPWPWVRLRGLTLGARVPRAM